MRCGIDLGPDVKSFTRLSEPISSSCSDPAWIPSMFVLGHTIRTIITVNVGFRTRPVGSYGDAQNAPRITSTFLLIVPS